MNPSLNSPATHPPPNPPPPETAAARSPLAQLLHALNQPLTGLQCSMEVALASRRTPEQYVRGLREGLELTERMRALVEALREVSDLGDGTNEDYEAVDLKAVLGEALDDLAPVAETKSVRITLDHSEVSYLGVKAGRRTLTTALFRFLESSLSLALRGTELLVKIGSAPAEARVSVRWHGERLPLSFSRPELGLLVAQAGFEREGALWERNRTENDVESVTIRLARVVDHRENS